MTALSIPERAREIATWKIPHVPHRSPGCTENYCGCPSDVRYQRDVMIAALESAMRSEREVCAKELDKVAEFYREEEMLTLAQAFDAEAKNMRDGGK